jgi:hypothetical protein
VLVDATPGFDNPFRATWRTVLVPTSAAPGGGPVWTGGKPNRDAATAMAGLRGARDAEEVLSCGTIVCARFNAPTVWVLGTDPFIFGVAAGDP